MWLSDASVWIDHFRVGRVDMVDRLSKGLVLMHPWVVGELACHGLKSRSTILMDLKSLPSAQLATDDEVLQLIKRRKFWGRGLGWVDLHLLGSALLTGCSLWTLDKELALVAKEIGLG